MGTSFRRMLQEVYPELIESETLRSKIPQGVERPDEGLCMIIPMRFMHDFQDTYTKVSY